MLRSTILLLALVLLSIPLAANADQQVELDLSGDNHPMIGPSTAPITIVEFSDFECPNCRRLEPTLVELRKEYGDRIRLVWMDFPLPAHRHALSAAIAARCAQEQQQFWPYHDALMSGREGLDEANLIDLADRLGLESNSFRLCLAQRKYQGVVESDIDAGDALELSATPTLIINDRLYSGGLTAAEIKSAIERIRNAEVTTKARRH